MTLIPSPRLAAALCQPEDSDVSGLIAELKAGVESAYSNHVSAATRDTYEEGWRDYLRFVDVLRQQGVDAPIEPEHTGDTRHLATLAMWLVWCVKHREVIFRKKNGEERVRQVGLKWSTVTTRLAAVVKALEERGVANPRANVTFSRIVDGLAREHTQPPTKVAALTGDRLRVVIDATAREDVLALRDHALVTLVLAGVPAARLPKLRWEQLIGGDIEWRVASPRHPLVLRGREDLPDLCPIRALARWRQSGLGGVRNGPVFPSLETDGRVKVRPDGSVVFSSKQALVDRAQSLAQAAGGQVPESRSLPLLDDSLAMRMVEVLRRPPLIVARDRCVLALGLSVGSRRRNLAEFVVGDVDFESRGMLVTFRRSKTDPYGAHPRVADISRVGGPYCPVSLTEEWLYRYAEAIGRPLRPEDPLFCRLDSWGNVVFEGAVAKLGAPRTPKPLSRPGFADIVCRRAVEAGLVGRYRSHSLRRGLATGLAKKKLPLHEIAKAGGWKSLDIVFGYIEEADRFETSIATLLGLEAA